MKVFLFSLNVAFGILVPLAIQLTDRRRMSPAEREWVPNFASWGAALYTFGPFALVGWGYVTRSSRYWWGLLVGAAMAEGTFAVQWGINEVLGRALALPRKAIDEMRAAFLVQVVAAVALAVVVGTGRTVYEAVRDARRSPTRGPAA